MPEFEKTVGSRAEVMHCKAHHTTGGLEKKHLKMKDGRVISKEQAKTNPGAKMWMDAVAKARKKLKLKKGEFVLIRKGEPLYETAIEIFETMKKKKKTTK